MNKKIIEKLEELIQACEDIIYDEDAIQRGERKILSNRIIEFLKSSRLMSAESYINKINEDLPGELFMTDLDYVRKAKNMKNVLISIKDKIELEEDNEQTKQQFIDIRKITIFVGHGRRPDWKDLVLFLQKVGFSTTEYNLESIASEARKETLERMLEQSNFACIVLTGEDTGIADRPRARENVIHELGLFQGKLGFEKTLMILESGVSEPSNIQGINQIRFVNTIRETFGDILLHFYDIGKFKHN